MLLAGSTLYERIFETEFAYEHITMPYGFTLYRASFLFMLAAYLALLMIYFGVNYFLGGMHAF